MTTMNGNVYVKLVKTCSLAAFVMLLPPGSAALAQTPDGQTPANEGVCDELMHATPGLYGLCVAYCEAQDCDADTAISGQCSATNPRILENYNKKKQAGDPDMPCIQTPCPCFTDKDLDFNKWNGCTVFAPKHYGGPRLDLFISEGSMVRAMVRDINAESRPNDKIDPVCTFVGYDAGTGDFVKRRADRMKVEEAAACRALMDDQVTRSALICKIFD